MTDSSPLLSILITNWNGEDVLRDCLQSVYEKTTGLPFEVIVVDDASTDQSVEMVRKEFPHARLIINSVNVGFVKANNRGVSSVRGKYVLLLNSDTLFIDNALKILTDFMESHPEVGVCGGWLKNREFTSLVSYGSYPSLRQSLVDALFLNDLFPNRGLPNRGVRPSGLVQEPIDVEYITGADLLIRKTLIDKLGLFDERFSAYCEETDLCYRVKHEAHRAIRFVPAAVIIHLEGTSYNKLGKRKMKIYHRSTNLFLEKHHGRFYALCTRIVYSLMHGVKLITRCAGYLAAPHDRKLEKRDQMLDTLYAIRYSLFPPSATAIQ